MSNILGKKYGKLTGTICLFILSVYSIELNAQSLNPDSIVSAFNEFSRKNLQEKIYVHTDKELYVAGEILWFKVYYVGSASNMPMEFSKIAYAEIIDNNQKPVMQARIALDKGSGSGSFQLPAALQSGTYTIRAYTSWMKNFGANYFFEKPIAIVNAFSKPEKLSAEENTKYDIQFFPEGGDLVEGLTSKVAFRAINNEGRGVSFRAALVDDGNDTIARFQPDRFGIGTFSMTPGNNKTYRAVIQIPGRESITKYLPSVSRTGYVLSVDDLSDSKIRVRVQSNRDLSDAMFMLIHTRQEPKITEKILLTGGKGTLEIDKGRVGDGISHITLFNSSGQPVGERLYFKKPSTGLLFSIRPDQQQYGRRKKVTLSIEAKTESENRSAADASVSVYASNDLQSGSLDIVNYLWLNSDLAGNIEAPGSYFKDNTAATNAALDNLMLTHGWRRFRWDDVVHKKSPELKYLPELEGDIIAGKITDTRTNSPGRSIMSYLSVPGMKLQLYLAKSDDLGEVKYFTKGISGPSELVAQTNTMADSTYHIELLSPFAQTYSEIRYPALSLDTKFRDPILMQSVGNQVQNIYLGNKMRTFYGANSDSSSFYGKPNKVYLLDNFVRFNTMEEVLREYVVEVPVTRQKDQFAIWVSYRAHYNDYYRFVQPLLVLDGVPVFDHGTKIIRYDPKKVRSIEVVDQNYFHGPLAFKSIINFKTYKNNLPDFQLDTRATVIDYDGAQLKREFYSPVYETEDQVGDRMPDFRNLLFWSPDVNIDASGKTTLSFYTSDQKSKYTVVVQGITSSGKPGSTTSTIEVK